MTRSKPAPQLLTSSDPLAPLLHRLLSAEQIAQLVDAHPSTIFRWTREGHFPKPFSVGGGLTRWRAADYNEWVEQRQAEDRDDDE